MLDHLAIGVRDLAASRAFYEAALAPLGFGVAVDSERVVGFGPPGRTTSFWLRGDREPAAGIHVAFHAEARDAVDGFHAAGLTAGGKDNGGPGIRANYHANYYAAFLYDPDGNNAEAVCHTPQ